MPSTNPFATPRGGLASIALAALLAGALYVVGKGLVLPHFARPRPTVEAEVVHWDEPPWEGGKATVHLVFREGEVERQERQEVPASLKQRFPEGSRVQATVHDTAPRVRLWDAPPAPPSIDTLCAALAVPLIYVMALGVFGAVGGQDSGSWLRDFDLRARTLTRFTLVWWGWGTLVVASFVSLAGPSPLAALAAAIYGAIGVVCAWFTFDARRAASLLGAQRLSLEPTPPRLGRTLSVRVEQDVRRELFVAQAAICLRCERHVSEGGERRAPEVLFEEERVLLEDHAAEAGERLALECALEIPSTRRLQSKVELGLNSSEQVLWTLDVRLDIAGRPPILQVHPIEMRAKGPGETSGAPQPKRPPKP